MEEVTRQECFIGGGGQPCYGWWATTTSSGGGGGASSTDFSGFYLFFSFMIFIIGVYLASRLFNKN